jgi:hypothetical protein
MTRPTGEGGEGVLLLKNLNDEDPKPWIDDEQRRF